MQWIEERYPRLGQLLDGLATLVLSSLLFWLCSALVITLPAALAALFAGVGGLVRPVELDPSVRFVRAFRQSLGIGLLVGLANVAVGLGAYGAAHFYLAVRSPMTVAVLLVYAVVTVIVAMVNVVIWPLLAWYPQPLGPLLKRAFLLTGAHPLLALGGVFAGVGTTALFLLLPHWGRGLLPAIGPGTVAAVISAVAWQAMKRYQSPKEAIDK